MSSNIYQIFQSNPINTNTSTDLMYFGQSPYTTGNDAAMTFSNFSAQFLASSLTSGNIFVGNGSNVAASVTMSGDATIANTGALTLASTAVSAGTYTVNGSNIFTVDGKGRLTSASSVTVSAAPSGSAGGDLSGSYPNPTVVKINGVSLGSTTATSGNLLIGSSTAWVTHAVSGDATLGSTGTLTLANTAVSAGTYTVNGSNIFTVDAKGRLTSASNVSVSAAPSGSAGGDLSGSYPNPMVSQINGVGLGTTTATSGNLLIGAGSAWVTHAVSGDATLSSSGALTVGSIGGKSVSLAGSFTTSGAYTTTFTMTGNTSVTFPTSGTLLTSSTGVTSISGTSNQVIASASTGSVTLSLPQSIATTSSPTFSSLIIPGSGSLTNVQGLHLNWNLSGFVGETDYVNNSGQGSGQHAFYNTTDTTTGVQVFYMSTSGCGINRSYSGANVFLLVQNNATTAGSGANLTLEVSQVTNSNPYINYVQGSVGGWASGLNTAGSNAFQLCYNGSGTPSLSSTLYFSLTTAGILSLVNKEVITLNNSTASYGPSLYLNQLGTGNSGITFDLNGNSTYSVGIDQANGSTFKISGSDALGTYDSIVISEVVGFNVTNPVAIGGSDNRGTLTVQATVGTPVFAANTDPGDFCRYISIANEANNDTTGQFCTLTFNINPAGSFSSGRCLGDMRMVRRTASSAQMDYYLSGYTGTPSYVDFAKISSDLNFFTAKTFLGGTASPTAVVHIAAGTAAAGTSPLKLTSGINLSSPESGAIEFDGTDLYFTPYSLTRQCIVMGNGGASAPTASVGTYPIQYYGGNGTYLGIPNTWVLVSINGTNYKMALYS